MKLEHHIAISTIFSGILYTIFKSWGITIASFCSGIFIDIDHIFDYLNEHHLRFNLNNFFSFFYKENHRSITLVFHAWEWLFCIGLATVLTDYNLYVTGIFIGYGQHIVLDYIYSKTTFSTYSLIWRWHKKFDSQVLFPRNRGYNP